ncbi:MAG: ABC transporter substrate-binding protein [Anaerolineales bacterium]
MLRKTLTLLFALTLFLAACGQATPLPPTATPIPAATSTPLPTATATSAPFIPQNNLTDSCVPEGGYDPAVDYFPEKVTITHAQNLSVEYHKHYKVVTIATPWPGATEPIRYALVQCGTPAPEGFRPEEIIEVPVRTIVTLSTTYLPFLDELGVLDRLVAVDDTTYVSNPKVLKMAEEGKLATLGYGAGINVEKALELQPDLIMAYGSGAPEYDAHPVLLKAGLKVALNAEWMDTSPLGRAEWGKYIALFFNKEAAAEALFAETQKKYTELARLTANLAEKPSVFANTPYQGTWYMPGGRSYVATLFKDAGANYLWADDPSTGSLSLSFEAVFERAKDADFWLNVGFFSTLEDLKAADPRFVEFAAFQKGNVWNNDAKVTPQGGNDYYETAVAHPELVLADLIKIFHPDLLPDHTLIYYRPLK